ncbi:MAG: hypothetical protein WBP93_20235 [Pyrinomonadaceae bacterium]
MKQIPLLIALALSLSLCNLSEKLSGKKTDSNSNSSSSSNKSGGADVEKPHPTSAQTAAISGGQSATWVQQGMSWTLPAKWKQQQEPDSKMFLWGGGDTAFMNVSISPMAADFPTDVSLDAFYKGAQDRQKNGEVDEVKWLELDGLKGVQFRESKPEHPDDIRRLQWLTYRKYAGQTQMVNLMLSAQGTSFGKHEDEFYGILYSTKITH